MLDHLSITAYDYLRHSTVHGEKDSMTHLDSVFQLGHLLGNVMLAIHLHWALVDLENLHLQERWWNLHEETPSQTLPDSESTEKPASLQDCTHCTLTQNP